MNQVDYGMHKKITRLSDGRQLIFYTFDNSSQTNKPFAQNDSNLGEEKGNQHV